MDLILKGFIAGVLGTLMMDSLNHLFARIGVISKIDVRIIGRMSVGWAQGRFRYSHPDEMECVPKRDGLWLFHALRNRSGACDPVRARLESPGWRACVTGMDICLWSRDNGSLSVFCIPFDGVWHVWLAVS